MGKVTYHTEFGEVTLYANDFYVNQIFQEGSYYGIDELRELRKYIDPDRNILEIGGHCGSSTIVYASFLRQPNKVWVFEPQKEMLELLRTNIRRNRLMDRIVPHHAAVFCESKYLSMHAFDLDGAGGLVEARYRDGGNCNFGGVGLGLGGELVQTLTIDEINCPNLGFIHCDAQGAENHIFAAGIHTIAKHRPLIFYENNRKYNPLLFENVCRSYPRYQSMSCFDVEDYCMNELQYSRVIHRFCGGPDDLLIP